MNAAAEGIEYLGERRAGSGGYNKLILPGSVDEQIIADAMESGLVDAKPNCTFERAPGAGGASASGGERGSLSVHLSQTSGDANPTGQAGQPRPKLCVGYCAAGKAATAGRGWVHPDAVAARAAVASRAVERHAGTAVAPATQ